MGYKFNPVLFSGLDLTGSGGGSAFFGDPVNTVGDLPPIGTDGELRVVKDTDSIYLYDATTTSWVLVTSPITDLRQITFTGSESTTFIDIPGFQFDPTVEAFEALVDVLKDGTLKETIHLNATKTSTTPQRTMTLTGEPTSVDLQVVESVGALKVQYKTDAPVATYKLTFRAITLT